ncbi:MAG: hypothetical protein F4Y60_02215 [Boseongicola sp. SB0664_bin_43]|uniref:Uncharacterized protein n=1 Tax=Boseongicola sp. SB0664_bin_43 TaxID=2604844 RepID=A0A6B0Y1J5_9RHOB|nr:hypothetical protein [Boseongicola sp. SB0664_bin_43]
MAEMTPALGARNLLVNCANARPGDRLLIAYEPSEHGYFDDDAHECVAREAERIGLAVDAVDVGFDADNPHLSEELRQRMQGFDIILFLARLGDQLRFSDMPQGKKVIVSFALNAHLLGSGFGNAHHAAFLELKNEANSVISRADEVRITCPAGSDVAGKSSIVLGPESDTTIMRFPMSVFTPVPSAGFSGRIALPGFLTGTGSRYYDDYTVEFDGPVHALLRDGRLEGFEGGSLDVERANAHYDRVSSLFGIDRNFVHSWHAGIHPGCGFPWDAGSSYERWGGVAFGNPRVLHFHTCGAYAPGEISWNVIDPSIEVDGVKYWERGTFSAELLPKGADILSRHPCAASLFEHPDRDIGMSAAA